MAKKSSTPAKAESGLPANFNYGDDAGLGYEGQTQDDIQIPLLNLLQKGSPQVEEGDMTAGHILNSVTEEAKEAVYFVPSITRHHYVEWIPRDNGGGFVAIHDIHSEVVKEAKARANQEGKGQNELTTPEGNELQETFEMSGVTVDSEGNPLGMAVIPFTSSKIKVYRKMNTRLQTFTPLIDGQKVKPPLYAHVLKVSSFLDKNKQDQRFHNFVLEPWKGSLKDGLLPPDHPAYQAAKEVWTLVTEGRAQAAHTTQSKEDPGEGMPF